jgi:DMSO/TMAO reductase YedYZ molybdopterin-dependent catalytic subunit
MSLSQAVLAAKPQLIPTNAGERTFAAPPEALQQQIIPNELFYIRNHWREPPKLDAAAYRLGIAGEVAHPLSLSLQDLQSLPERRLQVTFECCGNSPVPDYWAKQTRAVMEKVSGHGIMGNAEWTGVSLAEVLERAGLKSGAVEVVFTGADHGPDEVVGDPAEVTYERSLPAAKAMHPDTLLAYAMNGELLPQQHGFPLRLVVPGWYGMTSVKWLVGIRALDRPFDGFYQKERYMVMNGPGASSFYTYLNEMKVKSIITNPMPGEVVPVAPYRVAGAAWSGEREMVRVEVSTDGGQSWQEARLLPRTGYSWYRWELLWQPPAAGQYILMARATNSIGESQPMEFPNQWDGRSYGNNMVFRHPVEVRGASYRP